MLEYSFIRERIINNNSLLNYEKDQYYGVDLDSLYNDLSTQNEQITLKLKNSHPSILNDILSLTMKADSELLCPDVIGSSSQAPSSVDEKPTNEMISLGKTAYQQQISTTVAAIQAAESGDLKTLQSLKDAGVELNAGDYDRRTPLHAAVRA